MCQGATHPKDDVLSVSPPLVFVGRSDKLI
jgi:hypothetical protein